MLVHIALTSPSFIEIKTFPPKPSSPIPQMELQTRNDPSDHRICQSEVSYQKCLLGKIRKNKVAMCTFVDTNEIARNDQGNKSSSSRECLSGLIPSPFKSNKENRGKKCHREVVGIYSIQSRIRQHTTQHQTWISPTPSPGDLSRQLHNT